MTTQQIPRVLLLGTRGVFSRAPLLALIEGGVEVRAVVVSAPGQVFPAPAPIRELSAPGAVPGALPLLQQEAEQSVMEIAWERGIPVLEVASLHDAEAVATLASYNVDVLCVACFPLRLPRQVLELPPLGCLNVHPSLLPKNRGPVPLFWTFRAGDRTTGVSVHLMTDDLDGGDILEQAPIEVPDGIVGEEMDRRCSALGGHLLLKAVRNLAAGTARRTCQDSEHASYHGWPSAEDFEVPTWWSARRAFGFIRGISDWGRPAVLVVGQERFEVRAALDYLEGETLHAPYVREGSALRVQLSPGVLRVEIG